MANHYDKDIMLVEVAYNWRPTEYRNRPGPFPETPEGQRQFLEEVNRLVMETPHGHGKGIFWWEPAVGRGGVASRGMYDNEGEATASDYGFRSLHAGPVKFIDQFFDRA